MRDILKLNTGLNNGPKFFSTTVYLRLTHEFSFACAPCGARNKLWLTVQKCELNKYRW